MFKQSLLATLAIAFASPVLARAPDEPKQILHAWLTPTCPVSPDAEAPKMAPIFGTVLGWGIDYVVDWFGKALADAAQKDRDGLAISVTVPSYLYLYDSPHSDELVDGKAKVSIPVPGQFSPMKCLIIARASSAPSTWCGSGPFAAYRDVCRADGQLTGVATIARGATLETVQFQAAPADWPLQAQSVPSFYAEIALRASTDRTGVRAILKTLYYPGGIAGRKFENSDPRDLVISASATTPKGDSALSSFAIRLKKISPDARVRSDVHHDPMPWSAIAAIPDKFTQPNASAGTFAVNLKTEVREIGDANPLLQAAASIYASQNTEISKDLKAATPTAREAAAEGDRSKYAAQVNVAHSADIALEKACALPEASASDIGIKRSSVLGAYTAAYAAQKAAAKMADSASIPEHDRATFVPAIDADPHSLGKDPLSVCKANFDS